MCVNNRIKTKIMERGEYKNGALTEQWQVGRMSK